MPSLIRLLVVLGIIVGIGYGIMFALATFIAPATREISVTVPPDRFVKQH
jgi:phage shock protein PspC (stress-responsive transcriptional regulator)